jgi:S1-C subfamily serine protease
MSFNVRRMLFITLAGVVVLAGTGAGSAQTNQAMPDLVKQKGPAIVTVKFVLKISAGGQEREGQGETTGVMVDPKGLVLCANTQLGGIFRFARPGPSGPITATPSDFKVLVGDDSEGVEAKLLARDTELDLAWVQIKKPGDKPYEFVDFTAAAKAEVGQTILAVRRMGKFFDRVMAVSESRLGGISRKPRELYIPAAPLSGGVGLPVFTADGKVLGFAVLQVPEDGEGGQSVLQEGAGLILPAADVAKATKRAQESVRPETGNIPAPTTQPGK